MDFVDEVRTRSGQFAKRVDHLETEEATKSSLVLPFIQMLGYEIFDPTDVVPEFTAGGPKKGEKVDYALMKDGKPTILIECKKYGTNLDQEKTFQLIRYFAFTEAKFGILTDGIVYRFFSDLDKLNMMDAKPFFEFNMLDFSESGVEELKRFTKSAFNVEETVKAAATLKYTRGMKQAIARQLSAPDDEFVRWLARQVYSKPLTQQVRERLTVLAKQALREFVNDHIKATLETALEEGEAEVESETPAEATRDEDQPKRPSRRRPRMVSERNERYRDFFQGLIDTLRQEHSFTKARKAQAQSQYFFSAGHAQRAQYGASFAMGGRVRIELYIDRDDRDWNKRLFDQLLKHRTDIETEIGEALEWERLDDRRASRIALMCQGSIDDDQDTLKVIQDWIVERLLKFKEVFAPRLDELTANL